MTVTLGHFFCKSCKLTFEGEYKPQQRPRKSCPKCHKMVGLVVTKKKKKKAQGQILDPPKTDDEIIDDPNELLMSCAMRELNKSTPNVRWGNILLSLLDKTNQLVSKTKEGVMIRSKLVKYSSNQLIELRKKLIKS